MTTKHIAIWGAWYGSHNVGDQAILISIAQILEQALGKIHFTVFTKNPGHVLSYAPSESGCQVTALQNTSQFHRLVQTLAACDLFVIGGGVPFFPQPKQLLIMGTLVGFARSFGTPYLTWAVGSQIVTTLAAKRLFKWVLEGAAAVTCRDQATLELFETLSVKPKAYLVADPVFTFTWNSNDSPTVLQNMAGAREPSRPLAALIPRSLRPHDRSAGVHYRTQSGAEAERKIACFAAATDWLWNHGYQPIFVPMHTVAPDDDREAARRIIAQAKYGHHALLVDRELRPSMVPSVLALCQLALSARVHGAVTAMVANCPPVMYAFDLKHRGIMESMNLEQYVLDARVASPQRTCHLLKSMVEDLGIVKRDMKRQLISLQKSARIPGELARQILIDPLHVA